MLDKSPRPTNVTVPNDLAAHWTPFTANRAVRKAPRLLAGAKDMHYITVDGLGGTSVGGIVGNRKMFGRMLAGCDHLPHAYAREKQGFAKGEREYGAHFAAELERLVNLHGASTMAAVIVEPMAGSTGVLP